MIKIKVVGALFAVLFTATVGGAIWFPFVPVSDHTMSLDVDLNSNPVWRTYTFSTQDEQAVSWIRFSRDLQPHRMEWRWYSPDGQLYARTFGVIPPRDFTSADWEGKAWSSIQIKDCDPEDMPGQWRVDLLRDWKRVETEWFTIGGREVTC